MARVCSIEREEYAINAMDRKDGRQVFTQDRSMVYDRREKTNIDRKKDGRVGCV